MLKKNEINIVVAMEREAKPLINYWNLKKSKEKIFSDKKKKNKFNSFRYRKKKSRKCHKSYCRKNKYKFFFFKYRNCRS